MKCPDCGLENLPGEETCASCHASLSDLVLPQAKARDQKKILEGTLLDLKPQDAVTVSPDQTVADAVRLMREHKIGCVLVTRGKALAGVFTERDMLRKVAGTKDPVKVRISEVMRDDIECLHEDDTVAVAFHQMAVHDFRHIPVQRKNGRLGIITSRDLLSYLCK